MSFVKLIHDEEELKWFFDNVLPPLKETECYFISLSARNKYLTEEEREVFALGRTEMFNKTLIRKKEWNRFIRTIRKFECDERGYTTRNSSPIPSKSMVCYININPSDTLKAISEFQKLLNEYQVEIASIAFGNGKKDNLANRINKIDNNLMTCYQQATGTKHWIDFDFDIEKHEEIIKLVNKELAKRNVTRYIWLDTKSGYHLLLDKNQVKFDPFNFTATIEETLWEQSDLFTEDGISEIIYNKNVMIPLPGTLQGDHPVTILKEFSRVRKES